MKIENLRREQHGHTARVSATVTWEDSSQPDFNLHFETKGLAAPDLESSPHAFLIGCLLPALRSGEKRIQIEEEICPELLNGLETNMRWMAHWSGGQLRPLKVECRHVRREISASTAKRVGSFLSGGVDSLATLRSNRLDFAPKHPAAIRDCIVVHGFDIGGMAGIGAEEDFFARSMAPLQEIAQDAEVNLIAVRSNVRLLHDDVAFWMYYFDGAALASVAHSLSKRLTRMYIGSSFNIPYLIRAGSHPLVDPNYGSNNLEIRHDGLYLTRLEKVKRVAEWNVALRNLRVCTENPASGINCGICEKCLRTMLELLAIGKLDEAVSFPEQRIDLDVVNALHIHASYEAAWYRELLRPLSASGHHQIVQQLQAKLQEYEKYRTWEEEKDWKGIVKQFDRMYLHSSLLNSWKAIRPFFLKLRYKEAQHRWI